MTAVQDDEGHWWAEGDDGLWHWEGGAGMSLAVTWDELQVILP